MGSHNKNLLGRRLIFKYPNKLHITLDIVISFLGLYPAGVFTLLHRHLDKYIYLNVHCHSKKLKT